ncbi:MAG: hypothetical protein ABI134_30710 [Byssovorax sp.]
MPASHAQQKKALKHKKKREAASLKVREKTRLTLHSTSRDLLRLAAGRPVGPAFMSDSWEAAGPELPELVSVVFSRRAPGQILIAGLALVDRTCLGVKNAMLFPPQTDLELEQRLAQIGGKIGTLRRVEPLQAQSVVYHAIEYARSLGFAPHPDFPEALFGPRPSELLDTPMARPKRPFYMPGPEDDVAKVLARLRAAVGLHGFDITSPVQLLGDSDDAMEDEDEDEELEDDGDDAPGTPPPLT